MLVQVCMTPIGACFALPRLVIGGITAITTAYLLTFIVIHDGSDDLRFVSISAESIALYCTLAIALVFWPIYLGFYALSNKESDFSTRPWRAVSKALSANGVHTCPFTGKEAEMQCQCCMTAIDFNAFHEENAIQKGFMIGESPCLWGQAQKALETKATAVVGRVLLDEALHLRCNIFLGGVGDACIGCVTWIRCFQVLPRLAILLMTNGLLSTFIPFAFHRFIDSLLENAHLLYILLGGYGLMAGLYALAVMWYGMTKVRQFENRRAIEC